MRHQGLLSVAAALLLAQACSPPPTPELTLPDGLPLSSLPQAQKDLLRVTLEISEASLAETDVVLDTKDLTLSGAFNLQNVSDGDRVATIRVYGRFNAESEEVLLGRATDNITISEGLTAGLEFQDKNFESCEVGADGNCSILFDANRNLNSNILDLAPLIVDGGKAIDPAPQPIFVEASPETLQFPSGIRLGSFARQVIVIENRGVNPMTIDALDVGGGQGVALSLFDPFGGPVAIPRRSMPAAELTAIIDPGDELLVAVSFAPVNSFLTTAGIQIVARDSKTNVVQSTRVKVIANADGTLRPAPGDYVLPDIGASIDVGSGSIPVTAFPAEELFSGQEITDAGLTFKGATLTRIDDGVTFSMPADRGFVIDVPAETRLAVSITGLESDIDIAVVALDSSNAIERVAANSRHPLTSAEGLDFLNDSEFTQRIVVVLGRVDAEANPDFVPGGLALDIPAPFQLSCELSRGPEFKDVTPIAPVAGPLEGGTEFTLRGDGFQPGAIVTFADFRALDVVITIDPETGDTLASGRMPPGSLEVGKNPATAVVANPSIEAGGDGQAATLPEAFLYDPPAARIDVALPDVAPTTGAIEPITILGSFFTQQEGPIQVNFGNDSVEATFVDGQTLTATPGPAAAGTVVLTVQNQIRPGVFGAKSNGVAFRFAEAEGPSPTITSLDPATGAADGGDDVSITGSGFVLGSRVLVGSVEANVVSVDPGAISFTSPSVEFDGRVGVTVVNPDGQSANLPNAFTYFFPQPRIDGILPTRVPTTGGTLIIVTGASIRNGVTTVFKRDGAQDVPPLSAVRTSSTSVLVTTPPLGVGNVVISLTNPDGQIALSQTIEIFEPQGVGPTIVFVEPASGPLQGQNLITIAGNNFDPDGVRVVLAGTTFNLPVEIGAAAGFDRVQFVAPPSLTTGTEPIVLENGDGQSAVGTYLYVEVDVARIDQVLPSDLTFLPNTNIQIVGEFFSSFSSELQIFLGAGQNQQILPIVARSDGLIIGRVTQRLSSAGFTGLSLSDGVLRASATINVVFPTIASADARNDEIEVVGADLAGLRLDTLCAGNQGFRPTIADDDALVVRRDDERDDRCPPADVSPRPITLVYDNGAQSFAPPGAFVADEIDLDGDGVGTRDDADDLEPCVPNIIASVCDFDKDGLINSLDIAGQDPCSPSTNAAPCLVDTDGDGTRDPVDDADVDACVPNDQAITCNADADDDGISNPFDPNDTDTCVPNPGSLACVIDGDADGVTDPFDPIDDNPCIPDVNASVCDADNDQVLGGVDGDNTDPCVPDTFDVLCTDDDDGDGVFNASDLDANDACIPDPNALTCREDDDNDGVVNPFDVDDLDSCIPNSDAATCALPPTASLLVPTQVHAAIFGDALTFVGTRLDAVTTAEVIEVSTLTSTPAAIVQQSPTSLLIVPATGLADSRDVNSRYFLRVTAPAGVADSATFEALRPRVLSIEDNNTTIGFVGEFFNPSRIVDAVLDAGGGQTVDLTVLSASETFIDASVDSDLLPDLNYQLVLTLVDDRDVETALSVPAAAGFSIRRGAPSLAIGDAVVDEGGSATFRVSLSSPSGVDVSFDTATVNGTALAGSDFTAVNVRRTIPAGQTTLDVVVTTTDDALDEADTEAFTVTLAGATNAVVDDNVGDGTIRDNDGVPTVSVANVTITEGQTAAFVVTLSSVSAVDVSFDASSSTGTAGAADFTTLATTRRTITAGTTTTTINVATADDAANEATESFSVSLTAFANATGNVTTATAVLNDNDALPVLSVADVSVTEGGAALFTVSLSAASSLDVSFDTTTTNGTAAATDFTALASNRRTIPAGSLSIAVSVATAGDALDEDNETFGLALSAIQSASAGTVSAVATIVDDDNEPAIAVVSSGPAAEGTAASFVVGLSGPSGVDISFDANTTAGTASAADFIAITGSRRTIPAGALTTTITVPTADDLLHENGESFTLAISAITRATAGTTSAVGVINDNDAAPVVSIAGASATEGAAVTFAVSLSAVSAVDVTFTSTTATGTAGAGDFTALSAAAGVITAGALSTNVVVNTTNDAVDEGNEDFTVSLGSIANGVGGATTATGAINDDDAPPTVIIEAGSATEGGAVSFVVRLSAVSTLAVSFDVDTATGTASSADFTAVSTRRTIAAGALTTTVTVATAGDTLDENNEDFTATISNVDNATATTATAIGTIVDANAPPRISIAGASTTEGGDVVFVVSLNQASALDVDFSANSTTGSAQAADFVGIASAGTIAAGALTTTVTVTTADDALDELDESFTVALSGLVNATAGTATATGTIVDGDAPPVVSVSDASITESGTLAFVVTLSAPSGLNVTFTANTAQGTAVAADFTGLSASARNIPAGSTTTTINIATANDAVDEADEAFTLALSAIVNGVGGVTSATGTIVDDDAAPVLSIANASITEGGNAAFVVTLTPASALPVSFDFDTTVGTASGADFAAVSTRRTIAAGSTTTTVIVATTGDGLDENSETFAADLSAIANATGGTVTATGTIVDDDAPPQVSISGASITEGGTASFLVSLTQASALDVGFVVNTTAGTAVAADFTAIVASARTIPAGSTTATITVATTDDALDELDEAFTVALSAISNATGATTTATGTLIDNDAAPSLSIGDAVVTEGGTASFTVTLSAISGSNVNFLANTANGTTVAADFTALAASARSIAAGATTTTITVTTLEDARDEANETFTLTLSGIDNASGGDTVGVGTITDNDNPSVLSIANAAIVEGGVASFVVTLAPASDLDVAFDFDTTTGTASGADFTSASTRRTILAGATTTTVNVATAGDALDEANETFSAALSNIANATGGTVLATGTINDDDNAPTISVAPASAAESGVATFVVTLSGPSGLDVGFNTTTVNGSASGGSDFVDQNAVPRTIAAGSTTLSVTIASIQDARDENDETYTFQITNFNNVTAGSPTAVTGTVTDDDARPTLSIASLGAVAEGGTATFRVTQSAVSDLSPSFDFITAAGSAGSGDFTAVSQNRTILAGTTTLDITVATIDDAVDENASETFTASIANLLNADVGSPTTTTGTITDNDNAPTLTIGSAAPTEGQNAAFTVTLSPASALDVSFDVNTVVGSATSSDFAGVSDRRTILAGSTTLVINVPTTDDLLNEAGESFTVTLSAPTNAIGTPTGTGTITDNDAPPSISITGAAPVIEGQVAAFLVTLSSPSALNISFNFNTSTGTADAADFPPVGISRTILAGGTTTTINVATNDDAVAEGTEAFSATLSAITNASAGTLTAAGTINDNDLAPVVDFIAPAAIHALVTGDSITVTGSGLTGASAIIVRASDGVTFASTTTVNSATRITVRPDVILPDSVDVSSSYGVRVTTPAGTTTSTVTFDARKPRIDGGFSQNANEVVFSGEFFNGPRLLTLALDDGTTIIPTSILSKSDTSIRVSFGAGVVDGIDYRVVLTYQQLAGTTTFNAGTGQFCGAGSIGDAVVRTGANWTTPNCGSFFSGSFTTVNGDPFSSFPTQQCADWTTFRGGLNAGTFTRVTIRGSRDPVGVSCSGAGANTLCGSLRDSTASGPVACDGGRTWFVDQCAGGADAFEITADGAQCSCTSNGFVARPCINQWGGILGDSCSNYTNQVMEVICE
ncbi:MAG: Calx-beta domain-containing protein [Deltaproteobacteria bacterium]|nr:Calx-beta domain-containing protein [Deltaproteobacteria bacterium]